MMDSIMHAGTQYDMLLLEACSIVTILYFAWADQRDKVCFIFHKVARVLYGK